MTFCTIAFCWRLQNSDMELYCMNMITCIVIHTKWTLQSAKFLDNFEHVNQLSTRIICIIDFVHEIDIIYMTEIQRKRRKIPNQSINRLRNSWFTTSSQVFLFLNMYIWCLLLFNMNVCFLMFVVFEHECLLLDVCCFWTWMFVIRCLLFLNTNVCYLLIVVFEHECLLSAYCCL